MVATYLCLTFIAPALQKVTTWRRSELFLGASWGRYGYLSRPGLAALVGGETALGVGVGLRAALIGLLHDLAATGTAQVIVATHSSVIAALPGARILEFDADGYHDSTWDDLQMVHHHRAFLAEPMRYLRHVL